MSVRRWGSRDSFGQPLLAATNDIETIDDRRFRIRLKRPFSQMLYGLAARGCFMMPERMAKTPGTEQIRETVGSGPFRFLPDQWVSGVSAAYARFDGYVPRQEPPSFLAGGKAVNVQRVEWVVQPDSATAAAALQKGEVDWLEVPLIDLCPMLRQSPGVQVAVNDPFGWPLVLALNHVQPPFNNPKLRRALLPAIDQKTFLASVIGDQTDTWPCAGRIFRRGSADVEPCRARCPVRTARRRPGKRLVRESGYAGEKVVMLAPTDRPVYMQMMQVARDLFVRQQFSMRLSRGRGDWGESGMQQSALNQLVAAENGIAGAPEWNCWRSWLR